MNNQRWHAPKPSELATPGLVATILIVAFLLVLFATESGRQPGAQQLPEQAELFGFYSGDMMEVGWGSVSKPRREQSPRGALDLVTCYANLRFQTPTGPPRYYNTDIAYEASTGRPLHFTGRLATRASPTQEQLKIWQCTVHKSEILWVQRNDQWGIVAERAFPTGNMSVSLLHKYSIATWEHLLQRLERTEDGFVPAEIPVFDVESCTLSRLVCSQIDSAYADLGAGKDFYRLVQFGPNVIGYVQSRTMSLDQLIFTQEHLTIRRAGLGLIEQLPVEVSSYG